MTALRESYQCGGVRFEIDGPLTRSSHSVPEGPWRAIPHAGASRRRRFFGFSSARTESAMRAPSTRKTR